MAATESKLPNSGKRTLDSFFDPGFRPLDMNHLRAYLSLLHGDLNRLGVTSVALSADNHQLTADSTIIQKIDPNGGAKDVRLPTIADLPSGAAIFFVIVNAADASENVLVKGWDGTTESSAIVTIAQNYLAIVGLSGGSWVNIATIPQAAAIV